MKTATPLYRTALPSWFVRVATLSSLLLLCSCVPGADDHTNNAGGNTDVCDRDHNGDSNSGKGDDDDKDDIVKNANWSCTNDIGQTFYSKSDKICAQYYPRCASAADLPYKCVDPQLKMAKKKNCTSTATSTSTTTTTSTSTATDGYKFPDMPGRTCTIDTFKQQGGTTQYVKKVDILFVMDHSGSMDRHWEEIAQNIENMVQQLPSTTDIRYGVLLADTGAWSGKLYSPFNQPYLDNQKMTTAQISQALQQTFAAGIKVSDTSSGEAALYSLTQAVTKNAAANQKAGFFRADAGLSVIFMSDENDIGVSVPNVKGVPVKCDAQFEAGIKSKYYDANGITPASVLASMKALKGQLPVKASAFVNITTADLFTDNDPKAKCLYDNIGYGYIDIANASKGTLFSIQQDKATGLKACGQMIAQSLELQHDFNLSQPANQVDPATILNAVDGALVDGTYNASNDSEHIENAGVNGSTIQIRYCAPVSIPQWNLTNFAGVPSQTSVGLSWLTLEYATNGKVMWGTSANALNSEADETGTATNHALTVSGLTPNTTYYFQATSWIGGTSQSSPVIAVTTLPQWTLANVSAQAARTTATVQWTTAGYPTSGFVNYGLSANALTNQAATAGVGTSQTVSLSGLSPATTYYYQVVASDSFGQSQSSAVLSFTTAADWGISGFTGAATRTTVTLEWQTLDQVTNGEILWGRSTALGNDAPEGAASATNHQLVVSGLTPDTDYYFEVRATDPSGVVKTSNMILVHTAIDWSITNFAGTSTQTSVTLTWTTPGYGTSGSVAWGSDAASLTNNVADGVSGASHSVTITGLNPNTTYYFQASSTDADGITKQSAVVAIATQPIPLPVWSISGFSGTSDTGSVTVSWDTTGYATSGAILWGDSLATMNAQVNDTVVGTHHTVTITGLNADTIYFFQAQASDDRGQSQSSDVIQVKTATNITPPQNWSITGFDGTTTANQANLIWQTAGADTTAVVNVGLSPTDLTLMQLSVTTPAQTQQLAVPGLNASTTYYFQVTATDSSGVTHQSVVISKTTKAQ